MIINMYIIGHKNPDTDAIVCALIAADYFTQLGMEVTPIRLGELNKETEFILNYLGVQAPELKTELEQDAKICLVDHNETSQSIDNLEKYQIEWIIDHHKFSLNTSAPLNIRAESLASTASVLYKMYIENDLVISEKIAKLMICGILSDTLYFRSPTTTTIDKQIALALNEIAGFEDLEAFSLQMFDAKSDLSDFSAREIVTLDYKPFEFNGKKVNIGVMETTNPKFALDIKSDILEAMKQEKLEKGLDGILFVVVDILNEKGTAFALNEFETNMIESAFDSKKLEDNLFDIGSVVSRKKQIVPKLESYFA